MNSNKGEFYYPDEMTNENKKRIKSISAIGNKENVNVFTMAQNYIYPNEPKTQTKNRVRLERLDEAFS